MPVNGFSVGKDVTLVLVTQSGPLPFNRLTEFAAKMDTVDLKSKGIDGITKHLMFPDGWAGSFMLDRTDPTIDSYFAQYEANYYAGIDRRPASITEIISEPDGSITQWRYLNVFLKYDDAGPWKGDTQVKQKISFVAQTRIQVQ